MRYIGAFAIHNHHSLLRHIADVNKQVAVPPGLIGTLDGQFRGPVERRPGASIHDKPGTTGDVLTGGREKTEISFPMFSSFFEQCKSKNKRPTPGKQLGDRGEKEEARKRKKERNSPTRSRSVAVPGETCDLRVAATAEALAADGRYAGLISKACQIIDALDGFAGLRWVQRGDIG
jgi:hypothetical protein